jgi:hypothetical protein
LARLDGSANSFTAFKRSTRREKPSRFTRTPCSWCTGTGDNLSSFMPSASAGDLSPYMPSALAG